MATTDRNARVAARVEDEAIAGPQAVDGELQAAEPIALVRIGAGEIEDEIRAVTVEDPREVLRERRQILVVSRAVLERDVEIALFLAERKVLRRRASRT